MELKYHDTQPANINLSSVGAFLDLLFSNAQGTSDSNQRIGDSIVMKSIGFRFLFQGSSTDGANAIRIILFRWHEDDQVNPPTVAQLLTVPGAALTSPYEFDNMRMKKFTILYDKIATVDNVGTGMYKHFNVFKTFRGSKVYFDSSADEGKSKVYVFLCSDSPVVPHPLMSFIYSRITYTDA